MNEWLFGLKGADLDRAYVNVGSLEQLKLFRHVLADVFERHTATGVLGDSRTVFRNNLSRHFNAGAWHLLLLKYFEDAGFILLPSKEQGPDIAVRTPAGTVVYVEAVDATLGDGPDRLPDAWETPGVYSAPYPDPKVQLRLTNALSEKYQKIRAYLDGAVVSPAPIVVALNTGALHQNLNPGSRHSVVLRTLYALGPDQILLDRKTLKVQGTSATDCFSIEKASGARVDTSLFRRGSHPEISGVISIDADAYNFWARRYGGVEFIPNFHATHVVPEDFHRFPLRFVLADQDERSFSLIVKRTNPPEMRSVLKQED